jgi:hypothetical protein
MVFGDLIQEDAVHIYYSTIHHIKFTKELDAKNMKKENEKT